MKNVSRRQFISTGAMGLVAAKSLSGYAKGQQPATAALPSNPGPFDRPLSFQSFGMRTAIGEDFPGTLKRVKELGYAGVEMCSPIGYERSGFGNLTPLPPAEIKQQIADSGLFCKTCHFQSTEVLVDDPAKTADYAAALGLTDIIMSGSGLRDDASVDAIKEWGEKANKAGEVVKAAGLRLGYHNHAVGPDVERRPQFEHIMEALDPDLVTMQFQLASISGGYDIVYYLEKYAGRYSALHMHDWDPALKSMRPGRLGGIVPCGEGMIDWSALLIAALKSDIADHGFIVEIETAEPLEGLRRSINYLRTVEI